jgi:hypothetical protein
MVHESAELGRKIGGKGKAVEGRGKHLQCIHIMRLADSLPLENIVSVKYGMADMQGD